MRPSERRARFWRAIIILELFVLLPVTLLFAGFVISTL